MAAAPPPYTQNDPSAPLHGGYQQVPAKPQYGSAPPPSAPPYQTPYQPPTQRTSTHNTVIVTQQPTVAYAHVGQIKPNNYLVLSIINMLFCFFILGLIALIFSLQVDSAWSAGNHIEAQRSANIAKILNFIGIGVGIGAWIVVGVAVIANIAVAASYNPNNY